MAQAFFGCASTTRVQAQLCNDDTVQVLQPQQRVIFLDTDAMPAPELQAGDALSNLQEADVIKQIVTALQAGSVALHDIGIISPYRAQVCNSDTPFASSALHLFGQWASTAAAVSIAASHCRHYCFHMPTYAASGKQLLFHEELHPA